MAKTDFKSVNEYIASRPKAVQGILRQVRSTIRKAVPSAEEVISYQIPAYRLNGRPVVYTSAKRGSLPYRKRRSCGNRLIDRKERYPDYPARKRDIRAADCAD